MTTHRGLTWNHPRGYRALVAAQPDFLVWDTQPLEGFESTPIEEIAATYDVVVLDHPHVGEAVQKGVLRPMEDFFGPRELDAARYVGPSLASYAYGGEHWALPLDAATQVMALTPAEAERTPRTWDDVVARSEEVPVALSLAGPHALLTFYSLCVAHDVSPYEGTGRKDVLALVQRLARRAPEWTKLENPIGLLGAIGDRLAIVPLVYGYVGYPEVAFRDAPTVGGRRGSTLGGTGLAITRRCSPTPELLAHLRWLVGEEAQTDFIPRHAGQPSLRAAWTSPAVNRQANDFFARTLATVDAAWLRPRHPGYILFQDAGSAIVREGVLAGRPAETILSALDRRWQESLQA